MAKTLTFSERTLADFEGRATSLGIKMADLCARAKVAYTAYWRWKSGRGNPRLDLLDKIDAALLKIEARRKK